jgi:hypothetical protein
MKTVDTITQIMNNINVQKNKQTIKPKTIIYKSIRDLVWADFRFKLKYNIVIFIVNVLYLITLMHSKLIGRNRNLNWVERWAVNTINNNTKSTRVSQLSVVDDAIKNVREFYKLNITARDSDDDYGSLSNDFEQTYHKYLLTLLERAYTSNPKRDKIMKTVRNYWVMLPYRYIVRKCKRLTYYYHKFKYYLAFSINLYTTERFFVLEVSDYSELVNKMIGCDNTTLKISLFKLKKDIENKKYK